MAFTLGKRGGVGFISVRASTAFCLVAPIGLVWARVRLPPCRLRVGLPALPIKGPAFPPPDLATLSDKRPSGSGLVLGLRGPAFGVPSL